MPPYSLRMIEQTPVAEFDPNHDPAKLAEIGAHVGRRLDANPRVRRFDLADAQVYVYEDFLSIDECKGLIDLIDATAIPRRCTRADQRVSAPATVAIRTAPTRWSVWWRRE